MGISVSTASQFENMDVLKNTARNILNRNGASQEATQKIIEQTLFNNDRTLKETYINPQLSIIKASTQISLNNSLKETLRYLNSNANKKTTKKVVFGELWNIIATENEASEKNPYNGELFDFKIDENAKNIFAA